MKASCNNVWWIVYEDGFIGATANSAKNAFPFCFSKKGKSFRLHFDSLCQVSSRV